MRQFSWWYDLRQAVRSLARQPLFSAGAVLVLTLGIGLATAFFSLMNAVFLRPWQVADPDRVAIIRAERAGAEVAGGIPIAEYRYLRDQSRSFASIIAWQSVSTRIQDGSGQQLTVSSAAVSSNYFDALGVRMFAGRDFLDADEDYRLPKPVAIISHRLWRRQFDADLRILGRTVPIGRAAFVVVGVAPPGFLDVHRSSSTDLWMPLPAQALLRGVVPDVGRFDDPRGEPLRLMAGRLRDSVTRASAAEELTVLSTSFRRAASLPTRRIDVIDTRPVSGWPPGSVRAVLPVQALLVFAVTLVLLTACANAGNLLLARTLARRGDIAVRYSLGASRGRILRQIILEAAALSMLAGVLGFAFAVFAPRLMIGLGFTFAADGFWRTASPDAIRSAFYGPDERVFSAAMMLVGLTAMATALVPAVWASRGSLASLLAERRGLNPRGARWRVGLLAAQIAMTTVLLMGAGLLTRAIAHAASLNPGFAIKDIQVFVVKPDIPAQMIATRGRNFVLGLRRAVNESGLGPAAFTQLPPLSDVNYVSMIRHSGNIQPILTRDVSKEYFEVFDIPLVAGRLPDSDVGSRELVVSQSAAQRLWPNAEPVGQTLESAVSRTDYETYRVVGVAKDVPVRSMSEIEPVIYKPLNWSYATTLLIRTAQPGAEERVRALAQTLEPTVAVTARPMVDYVRDSLATARLASRTAWVIGALGIILAIAGTFGVFAQAVEEGRRDVAIRLALGASRRQVAVPTLRPVTRALGWGAVAGFVLSLVAVPVLRHFLYGLHAFDPMAYVWVTSILVVAAVVACWIPLRRAMAADPAVTLRAD